MESEYTNDEYTIGWICALQEEFDVATAMFTEEHGLPQYLPKEDNNAYMLGQIGHHKVVMACLPAGRMGTNSAAVVADSMRRTFKSLRFGLLVGIGGGVPKPFVGKDVRLGDVVVSVPKGAYGGVVQYDFRKLEAGKTGVTHLGHLCSPPEKLLTNVTLLQNLIKNLRNPATYLKDFLAELGELSDEYEYPAVGDKLFQSDYIHYGSKAVGSGSFATDDCAHCDEGKLITGRKQRKDDIPVVHLGTIASGNSVIKDATVRDYIDECYENTVLCFEMEAAGLMNTFPCLVVRGISDYADSHKNDGWRNRAIAAASVYAKALITIIRPEDVVELPKVDKLMEELTLTVKDVNENMVKVSGQMQEDREERGRKQILDWITSIDYDSQLSDIAKKSQEGTGRWLLDSPEYQNWANGGKQTLYCPGIPGAGKTVLTSIIIHDLLDRFSGTSGFGLAYIFCDYKKHETQTLTDLLSSLLKQLAGRCSPLPSELKQLYSKHNSRERKTRPREAEIVTTLRAITKLFTKSFIIVDALDECQKADGCRTKFLNVLFDIQKEVGINILATSRSDGDISRFFEGAVALQISASRDDVKAYLADRMGRLEPEILDDEVRSMAESAILEAADGMFLLATLYANTLEAQPTKRHLKMALRDLKKGEKGLAATYIEAIERIKRQSEPIIALAKRCLGWIIHTGRLLSPDELRHALAVFPGDKNLDRDSIPSVRTLESICAGLVVVDEASNTIRLVHYTAQEFFRETEGQFPGDARVDIVETCIAYLSFESFSAWGSSDKTKRQAEQPSYPLYDYAARNWVAAMRRASMDGERIVVDFISNHNNVIAWIKTSRVWRQSMWEGANAADAWKSLTAYHIAARFGLPQTILRLLDFSASDVDVKDSRGRTPLSYAAEVGHDDVISLLISKGEVDINAGDYFGFSPLSYAAWEGHTSTVELLLSKGADKSWSPYPPEGLGTRRHPPPFWDRTPMVLALERGHASTVALLFEAIIVSSFEREFGKRPSRRQARDLWETMLKGCPKVWLAKEHFPGHLDDAAAAYHDFLAWYLGMDTKKYFDPSIVSPPPRNGLKEAEEKSLLVAVASEDT